MQPAPSLLLRGSLVVSYAVLVVLNVGSSRGWFGPSQADVASRWTTSLTPAGWAFSIWGLIFSLQGAGVAWAAVGHNYGRAKAAAVNAVAIGWQLTWLCESAWLLCFPLQTTASFWACAALLLAGFACIAWTAARTRAAVLAHQPSSLVFGLYVLPSSLNAAWMSVASCLGVAVLAVSQGIPAAAELRLAAGLAAVAVAGAVLVVLRTGDVAWGAVLIWALAGVRAAHPHVELMRVESLLGIALVGLTCAWVCARHWQAHHHARGGAARLEAEAGGVQERLLPGGGAAEGGDSGH